MENNLPKGWSETNLSEVVSNEKYSIVDGPFGSHLKRSDYVNEGIPLVRILNIAENFKFNSNDLIKITIKKFEEILRSQINPGDILFSKAGTIGRVCIVPDSLQIGAITSSCAKIKIHESLNRRLFLYQLSGSEVYNYLLMIATGSTRLNLNLQSIKSIPVKVPPLTEQHRIVAKLDTLFEKIESNKDRLEKIPKLLKRFRQSVLAAAVSGKLTEEWRKQQLNIENASSILDRIEKEKSKFIKKKKEFIPDSEYEQIDVPDTWILGKWDNYLDHSDNPFRRGPFGSALKKEIFISSGYKIYEQYCPINDDCSFARYFIDERKFKELKNFAVKAGDFLISCSGVTLGRITQIPEIYDEGIINQALLRVRINQRFFESKFFLLLFRSPNFQRNIFENSTGSAIPNVKGVEELKSIPAPILSLEEQKEIVRRVDQLFAFADKIEARYNKAKFLMDKLPQSLLAKAFRGELVPQDSNDEPASVLLERIKNEKKKLSENKKNKNV